jgi:hypothetical protein
MKIVLLALRGSFMGHPWGFGERTAKGTESASKIRNPMVPRYDGWAAALRPDVRIP